MARRSSRAEAGCPRRARDRHASQGRRRPAFRLETRGVVLPRRSCAGGLEDGVTSSARPDAWAAMEELLRDHHTVAELAVASRATLQCSKCRHRIGVVVETEHGHLWLGFLGDRRRRKVRRDMGVSATGENVVPIWIEARRPFYIGECDCPRNAVESRYVMSGSRLGGVRVVPPQR